MMDQTNTIIFDSGASTSVSNNVNDFIGNIFPPSLNALAGLSEKNQVKGEVTVQWRIEDDYGRQQIIETHAYYVPAARVRLFSPKIYYQEKGLGSVSFDKDSFVFTFADIHQSRLTIPYHKGSNLPIAHLDSGQYNIQRGTISSVIDDNNTNLTSNEKELLWWHYKLGHYYFGWIQYLMRKGQDCRPQIIPLPPKCRAHRCNTKGLLCTSCQIGKGKWTGSEAQNIKDIDPDALKADDLHPGNEVSVD